MQIFKTLKNWYQINDSVTYSTNYRFFKEHDIKVVDVEHNIKKVVSNIDNRELTLIKVDPNNGFDLDDKLRGLHASLLSGEIYEEKGLFVN